MALNGDTIIIEVEFKNNVGVAIEVTDVKLRVLDSIGNELNRYTDCTKLSTGKYERNYTVPMNVTRFIVSEYSAMYGGFPYVERIQIPVDFSRSRK